MPMQDMQPHMQPCAACCGWCRSVSDKYPHRGKAGWLCWKRQWLQQGLTALIKPRESMTSWLSHLHTVAGERSKFPVTSRFQMMEEVERYGALFLEVMFGRRQSLGKASGMPRNTRIADLMTRFRIAPTRLNLTQCNLSSYSGEE